MKPKQILLAAIIAMLPGLVFAGQFRLDSWVNHNSYLEARSADTDTDGNIWCGTSGGLFMYDVATGKYKTFNNIDGLLSLDISLVKFNPADGNVYIGTNDGYLDIYTSDGKWVHVTDIKNSSFANKQIKDIEFLGGRAYIATAFGISVLDTKDYVFLETILKIGDFPANAIVNEIMAENGRLWAATDAGLAVCSLGQSLSIPTNWNTYELSANFTAQKFSCVELIGGSIYASTVNDIYMVDADTLEKVVELEDWEIINNLLSVNDSLYWTIDYYIRSVNYMRFSNFDAARRMKQAYFKNVGGKPVFILSFRQAGLALLDGDSLMFLAPNSPASNNFLAMDVDSRGNLWVASGTTGILKYDGSLWHRYQFFSDTGKTSPKEFKRVTAFGENSIIASSWGTGFSIFEDNNSALDGTDYYTGNSPLTTAVDNNDTYFVTGESIVDSKGIIWIINYGNNTQGPLLVGKQDDKWHTFYNTEYNIKRQYEFLAIDNYGTKWLGSNSDRGLYYYNDRGTFENVADDKSGSLTKSNSGLPDNQITSLVVDKNGLLWIGTYEGIRYIAGASGVINGTKINVREPVPRLLRDEAVNDLMVDAVNNLWIATNNGVFIMDAEQNLIENYTTKNSPLISDKVISLATDPHTGRVFIATDKGMTEARSLSVLALDSYNIRAYPQPFDPQRDSEIVIEGLAENTAVKILKVNGEFVRSLETTSRVVVWDGRDDDGNYVSTGVYLIVASSETLGNGTVAKIAVIRNN